MATAFCRRPTPCFDEIFPVAFEPSRAWISAGDHPAAAQLFRSRTGRSRDFIAAALGLRLYAHIEGLGDYIDLDSHVRWLIAAASSDLAP